MIAERKDWRPIREDFAPEVEPPPLNLFKPAAGRPPPELAGRDEEIQRMLELVTGPIEQEEAPDHAVLLHGARGVGKTCLIKRMLKTLRDLRSDTAVLQLRRNDFQSPEALIKAILEKAEAKGRLRITGVKREVGLREDGYPVLSFGVQRSESGETTRVRSPLGAMELATHPPKASDKKRGLLLVLDEVHTLVTQNEKGRLQNFLNDIQDASGEDANWPVGLIMAGTPDAYGHLASINATFVERMIGPAGFGGNMPLGCLDGDAVRQALKDPLQMHGKLIDDDVLKMALEETSGYPYFVQIMGNALCQALHKNDHWGDTVTLKDAQSAIEAFQKAKHEFYSYRRLELKKAGALESTLNVINALNEKGVLTDEEIQALCVDGILRRDEAHIPATDEDRAKWVKGGESATQQILHAGLIWGAKGSESDEFRYAIPSLAAHTLEWAAQSDMEHLRELANASTGCANDNAGTKRLA